MSKSRLTVAVGVALLLAAVAPLLADEATLIAVLKSDAARKAKADACRQLAREATEKSVPVLAGLLSDEKLSHMARYAMETIAHASVDEAFRAAAGKLKGRPLVGVIGSLGVRRDGKAVAALKEFLGDADPEVARAAARALGSIGGDEAVKALQAAVGKAEPRLKLAVCEGLLRCAEALRAGGKREQAVAIYDGLRKVSGAAHQVRTGALRGALLAREKGQLPLLRAAVGDKQYVVFSAALRASMEMPGKAVTEALLAEMKKLPADRQLLMVQTLGARGDTSAGPALLAAARNGAPDVRLAAVRGLTRLGHAPAVAMLSELALGDDADLAREAQKCLANFPGGEKAVVALLDHKDPAARRLGVEMVGRRALKGATPSLLKAARDDDVDVRTASLRVLRDVAAAGDLDALLKLLVEVRSAVDVRGAEEALRTLCAREASSGGGKVVIRKAVYGDLPKGKSADVTKKVAELVKAGATSVDASNENFGDPVHGTAKRFRVDYTINGVARSETVRENDTVTFTAKVAPPAFVEAFCAALPKAPADAKAALLRILRSAGGGPALKTVREALDDSDAKVKDAAARALCGWQTADALPAVTALAKTAKDATLKVLALRATIRLAVQQVAPPATVVASLKDALSLARRDPEKRLILSALGNIPSPESLALVTPFLSRGALKEEACLAAVAIGEKIVADHPEPVGQAMQKVALSTNSKQVAARAEALAKRARKP